jgi:type IV secretion system protein TrbG
MRIQARYHTIVKQAGYVVSFCMLAMVLTGCQALRGELPNEKMVTQPNHVVTERIPVPTAPPPVAATFPLSTHTAVIKAYQQYSQRGVAEVITGDGFVTYPFDQYSKPIIQCAPLHLCIVQLQQGERVNDIALGDSAHWQVSTALIGTEETGTYQVSVKPSLGEIATDLVITTNQRSYHLGLVSEPGKTSQIVSFYYPAQTLAEAIKKASHALTTPPQETFGVSKQYDFTPTHIANTNQLNFNYHVHGHKTAWRPIRAFDDGNKTFIQMPPQAAHTELPVLYIARNHEKQLVNYRYQQPYFILDQLFERAYLIAGKGRKQTKVMVDNQVWRNQYLQHDFPRRVAQ